MQQVPILVVEDEAAIAKLIEVNLRHAGFAVHWAKDIQQAEQTMKAIEPALVLLDWMLPGGSGLDLLKRWRSNPRTRAIPVIMLTARGDEHDKIAGLEIGADDYVTKPFSPRELVARIQALLRRHAPEKAQTPLEVSGLRLNPATHSLDYQGQALTLGPTEFRLLAYLMAHPARVHSRTQLLEKVWGLHTEIEERTVDVHIKRLREALGSSAGGLIETVRGFGYMLNNNAVALAD